MSTTPESSATIPRRVAVIAVHGVADQQPGETTTAIANLLSNIDDGDRPAYGPFESESVRLPVRAIQFEDRETHKHQNWATRAADCREGRVQPAARTGVVDAGLEFMSSLLAGYEPSGPEETYETAILRGYRFAGTSGEARNIDVYEMYWADLSRLKLTWLRIFSEFYQLLFHLGSLGVHAVRAGQASEPGVGKKKWWKLWAKAQRHAADVLAKPVLLMNLFLPGLLLVLFAALPSEPVAAILVWGSYLLLALGLIGAVSYYRYKRAASVAVLAWSMVVIAGVLFVVLKRLDWPNGTAHLVLATVVAGAVAALIAVIVFFYNRRRPGAALTAAVLGSLLTVWLLVELWILPQGSEPRVQAAVLHSAEYVNAALRLSLLGFLLFAWGAQGLGAWIVWRTNDATRDRLKRLAWTARFTLSLPVVLFLLGTTVLWYLVWMAVKALFGGVLTNTHHLTWLTHRVVMPELGPTLTVNGLVEGLINNGSGHGFGVLMGLVLLASVLAAYAIAPSIFFELRPPDPPRDGTASGRWLDGGFHLMRGAGRLLVFGVLVALPGFVLMGFILSHVDQPWFERLVAGNTWLLVTTGAILAPAGAGLVLFNRLKQVTLGFRNVVDVLLDVDNYLREHPRKSNPRARIATRMASLLRYVYAQNYSSLVIIAHSQGTVITADLLRFIHLTDVGRTDPGLARRNGIPISFFTMGSPLRQLYGLRFPHLYQWARHQVPGPWSNEGEPIAADTGPDPAELDLALWVNAYRSADYIGRYLWRPEECHFAFRTSAMQNDHPWQAGAFDAIVSRSQPPLDNRREFCIGAGAHQHYWDGTAPQVALQLDALIRS